MKAGEVLKKITPHVSSISLVGWLLVLAVQGSAWIYQTYFSLGDVVIAAVPICERYSFGPVAESPNFDGDQAVFNRNWKDYKYVGVTIFASRTVSDVRIRFHRVFHVVRWGIVSDGLSDPELEAFLSELPTGSLRSAEFITPPLPNLPSDSATTVTMLVNQIGTCNESPIEVTTTTQGEVIHGATNKFLINERPSVFIGFPWFFAITVVIPLVIVIVFLSIRNVLSNMS